ESWNGVGSVTMGVVGVVDGCWDGEKGNLVSSKALNRSRLLLSGHQQWIVDEIVGDDDGDERKYRPSQRLP
nr:hypothetical protein [Tanacetum cinerariifolium]